MTPKQILHRAQSEPLIDQKGRQVRLHTAPAFSRSVITALEHERRRPFPAEVRELLEVSRGVRWEGSEWPFHLDESQLHVAFAGRGWTGYPGWIDPTSSESGRAGLELMSDICGNPWVVDVGPDGTWGSVFYVSHDPPLVAYQSEDFAHFLLELAMLYSSKGGSRLIREATDTKLVPLTKASTLRQTTDAVLNTLVAQLKDEDRVADLRGKTIGEAFEWGLADEVKRGQSDLLFGLSRAPRKGFLSRLFGTRE